MKTYIPTIGLIASLAFACANGLAQNPTTPRPQPATPVPPTAPRAVAQPAQPEAEAESAADAALAAQDEALAAQDEALRAQDEALENVNKNLNLIGARSGRATSSTRSLVIPKDPPDAKNLTETEEDMSVMARILEKAGNSKRQKSERSASVGAWSLSGSSATAKNLYIDGFGALFFLNVNYPLLAPATKEQPAESKRDTDSEWEIAHNELYRPQSSGSDFNFNFTPFDSGSYAFTTGGPAEEYDEDKVTQLKENLTAALKNASHIRRLKGDDTVTVIVSGRNPGSGAKVTARRSHNGSSSSSSASSWSSTSRSGSQAPAARLIIRAKRSDIESLQKDKLSVDDFRKKVTMFIY
jgi:hypothetical protein